jgi:trehalose transport system substrate-binding protein
MRSRFKGAIALVAVLALLGAACGGGKKKTTPTATGSLAGTTITFSGSYNTSETAVVQGVLKTFQDQTGVKVNFTQVTAQDIPQKLQVEVSSNHHTIQLFAQDNLALAVLVEKGLVEDLSDIQVPSEIIPALAAPKFDGKQYFLPYRANVRVTYANKDEFASAGVQPPTTTDQFKTVAEKLKQAAGGQAKVTLSFADQPDTGPLGVTISEWVVSYGGNPLLLNDNGSVQAFTFLQGLWKEGVLAKESLQGKFDTEINYLRGATSWLATNWPTTSAQLSDLGILDKFQVFAGYSGPAGAAHVIGGEVLGIPKGVSGKQKDAAIALAQFLESKDAQQVLVAKNAWPAIRSDGYAQVPEELKPTYDAVQAALKDGFYRPNVIYWSDVEAAMDQAIQRVIVKGEPVQTVLNELHDKIAAAAKSKGAQYPPASS